MKKSFLFYFVIFTVLCMPTAHATDYYVSPEGNDTQSCLGADAANACREIRVLVKNLQPGDTIHVADGEYSGFTIVELHGTHDAPISIVADAEGALVMPTTDRAQNRDNISISDSSFLVIDGLQTSNATRAGLFIKGSDFIVIVNSGFNNNGKSGIFTSFCEHLHIANNIAYANIEQHGIYVSNSADFPVIRNNIVFANSLAGIHINSGSSTGADASISGAVIEGNIISKNGLRGGAAIYLVGVKNAVIRNNVLYDNFATGIALLKGASAKGPDNVKVYNNTIDMSGLSRWAIQIFDSDGHIKLRNNIIIARNTQTGTVLYKGLRDVNNTDSNYNLFAGNTVISPNGGVSKLGLPGWQNKYPNSEGFSLLESDLDFFVDAAARNYRLNAGAKAINAGENLIDNTQDLVESIRPLGAGTDMGAYEFIDAFLSENATAAYLGANNNRLFIPSVDVDGLNFQAELELLPSTGDGNLNFQLISVTDTDKTTQFQAVYHAETQVVSIPKVDLLNAHQLVQSYQVELKLLPATQPMIFQLSAYAFYRE